MIVPFDMALDREYWQFLPEHASVHVTRLPIIDLPYGVEHASRVAEPGAMYDAVQTLVRIEPAAIGFGCTSGSFVGGVEFEQRIRGHMETSGARVAVTPMSGLVDALHSLGARRVGLGTPYGAPVAQTLAAYLEQAGFEPVSLENLEIDDEEEVIAASDDLVYELARRAMRPNADAVFLSCTNLPTFAILGDVERAIGVPVLSANQTLMWGLCHAAGIPLAGAETSLSRIGVEGPAVASSL
jgi:maleate isomerase